MFGITEAGNSVVTHVHGFTPYFICDAPPDFQPSQLETFRSALNNATKEQSRGQAQNASYFVLHVEILMKRSLVGFTAGNKPSMFLKIFVTMPKVSFFFLNKK